MQIAATISHMLFMLSPRCKAMPPTAKAPVRATQAQKKMDGNCLLVPGMANSFRMDCSVLRDKVRKMVARQRRLL
jgi:hypothetical protein